MWVPINHRIWGVPFTANLPLCWICSFNETSPKMEQNSWDANISQMWHAQRWCDKCQCCQCPQLSHFMKVIILLGEILKVVWLLLDCWLHAAFLVTENTWRGETWIPCVSAANAPFEEKMGCAPIIYNDRAKTKKNESGSVRTPPSNTGVWDHLPFLVYILDSTLHLQLIHIGGRDHPSGLVGCKMLGQESVSDR